MTTHMSSFCLCRPDSTAAPSQCPTDKVNSLSSTGLLSITFSILLKFEDFLLYVYPALFLIGNLREDVVC